MKAAATKRFVLDASVAVAWCFEDETTRDTEAILELLSNAAEALTPAMWPMEVANALLMAERRKRITDSQLTDLLRRISALAILVEPVQTKDVFEQILPVARRHGLSQYDAAYVELALRQSLPLATLDEELRRAAKRSDISLLFG
jgi:predicted nucleic acid-binding protein